MTALLMHLLQPTPSEQLDKSNHTDKKPNETSCTKYLPTSSHSTITGSKSIDASNSKFNSQEMKSKSLPLPSKDDTIICRLKPEGNWHEVKITRRGGKATGLHSGWFNVKSTTSDNQYSINFENVEWKKQENVNVVIIPKLCEIHQNVIKQNKLSLTNSNTSTLIQK